MKDLLLSIDLGTTAVKIALMGVDGDIKAISTQEYQLLTPQTSYVEVEPNTYWESFKKGLSEIKSRFAHSPDEIKAIGISAQGETLFFLDDKNESLRNAIVWMDSRAQKEAKELTESFTDEECYRITGQVGFDPCWPASKILWVRKNQPDVFKRTRRFMLIEDYFIYRLTGQFVSEGSLLCSTTYWDINTKNWWQEMLKYLQISKEQLPEIRESGEAVGRILPSAAKELELGEGTVICTGALDQAAGAVGAGNIEEGIFSENIGAALAICVPLKKPKLDPARKMPLHYFCIPDMYMFHTFTTGGMVLRWYRDNFCRLEMNAAELINKDSYDLLSMEASRIEPGSEGLIVLPHLSGSMAPDINPNAKGVFYGLTLKHGKPHVVRAIMEAIGYIIRRNIDTLANMDIKVNEIRSLGGGSKSSIWNQIKSDITQKQIITMECDQAACLGAGILAGKGIGLYNDVNEACKKMIKVKEKFMPDKSNSQIYDSSYKKYMSLFSDLSQMFNKF